MITFNKINEWIGDKLRICGAACLVAMMLLTCVDVVGRYMGRPVFGAVEIVIFLSTMTVSMALPYTHKMKGHIGVEMLVQAFSARTQAIIEITTSIFSFCLMAIIAWRMFVYAYTIQQSGEVSMNLKFPEYILIYLVALCFLMVCTMILTDIIGNIKKIRGK